MHEHNLPVSAEDTSEEDVADVPSALFSFSFSAFLDFFFFFFKSNIAANSSSWKRERERVWS